LDDSFLLGQVIGIALGSGAVAFFAARDHFRKRRARGDMSRKAKITDALDGSVAADRDGQGLAHESHLLRAKSTDVGSHVRLTHRENVRKVHA